MLRRGQAIAPGNGGRRRILIPSPGQVVSLDLAQFFAGFTASPVYDSPAAAKATGRSRGKTATFAPASSGHARFSVKVTDSNDASMTREVFVFVDGP